MTIRNVLLLASCCALFIKSILLYKVIFYSKNKRWAHFPIILLTIAFIGELLSDCTWFFEAMGGGLINHAFEICLLRIAWAFYLVEFHVLGMLLEYLCIKAYKVGIINGFLRTVTFALFTYFIGIAIFNFGQIHGYLETEIMRLATIWVAIIIIPSFIAILRQWKNLPRILQRQISIFSAFLIPKIILEQLQNNLLSLNSPSFFPPSNFLIATIVIILNTYFFYFCITKLLRLRFLNGKDHVNTPRKEDSKFAAFIKDLTPEILNVENHSHLTSLTRQALHTLFVLPPEKITVWVDFACFAYEYYAPDITYRTYKKVLEKFRTDHNASDSHVGAWLYHERIAVRDEIEFSHYYEPSEIYATLITLLDQLEADIIIPLYENNVLIGAIIVAKGARKALYNEVEQHEMVSFAHYLAGALLTFKYQRFESVAARNKMLCDTHYYHEQQAKLFEEALAALHRESVQFTVGMIQYSDKKFYPCTPGTADLLDYDFSDENHPLHAILSKIVQRVSTYHQPYEQIYKLMNGKQVKLTGVPFENTIYNIAVIPIDAIERVKNIELKLTNFGDRDYLLLLETTRKGKLINELVPGNDPALVNVKVALLKAVISKNSGLLCAPQQDVELLVNFIHQVGERNALHFLALKETEQNNEIATKLFGTHSSFDETNAYGLLEQLQDEGTLCIENIHLLSLETQKLLSRFLRLGYFTPLRSAAMIESSVRIIATTPYNLHDLMLQNAFYPELAELLLTNILEIPSLTTLTPNGYEELLQGYVYQTMQSKGLAPFMQLTNEDKEMIQEQHPASLTETKKLVHKIIIHKTTQKKIEHLVELSPAAELTDETLIKAKQLGKHALKDDKLLMQLWKKFHNQSHIAELLGVHRSSVHRRLKDLHITH